MSLALAALLLALALGAALSSVWTARAALQAGSARPGETLAVAPAPSWFVAAFGTEARGGAAAGSDADALLWRVARHSVSAIAALAVLAAAIGALLLARLRRRLADEQAQAQRQLAAIAEPAAEQMQQLTRNMNAMVVRLKAAVETQVAQVEQLRRQAHLDPSTGLANRRHFLARLEAALQREDGAARCGLVLMRLRDLAGVNRLLGHAATDRMLAALAQTLATYAERAPGCIAGRLNGSDFALCLPVGAMAQETAQALATTMRAVLPAFGPGVTVSLGGAELLHGQAVGAAMACADEALARAELCGAFGVEVAASASSGNGGESAWRRDLETALAGGSASLSAYPLVDSQGGLVHLESPLRLQLRAGGAFEPAASWLPLATRTGITGACDLQAASLALHDIVRDGRPRSVNLAPASLGDGEFAAALRALLFANARAARKLAFEIDESAAVERFAALRELARLVRPCGVRFGLEHAGQHLATIDHLFEDWVDFVKLDASLCVGTGLDEQRAGFVRAAVGLLHGLAIAVYAEGVSGDDDAAGLWACGVDGITGPWATARFVQRL